MSAPDETPAAERKAAAECALFRFLGRRLRGADLHEASGLVAAYARACEDVARGEAERQRAEISDLLAAWRTAASAHMEDYRRLGRERDEALAVAEGPSTLRDLAASFLDAQLRRHEAERERDDLRARLAAAERALKDAARLDWLEEREVSSIYFRNGGQLNPASMSLRAALDAARAALGARCGPGAIHAIARRDHE